MVLSREPARIDSPHPVVNHVSDFGGLASALHVARLASLALVRTPFFCWVDVDDPLPEVLPAPQRGLLYGVEEIYNSGNRMTRVLPRAWSRVGHLTNPRLIHKAVCSTEAALDVAALLPQGEYYTELLLYYGIAKRHGWEIDERFVYHYETARSEMAGKVAAAIGNSMALLLSLEKRGVL